MEVIKRNGKAEPVAFDKIADRIRSLCEGLAEVVLREVAQITQLVISSIYNRISTTKLDEISAAIAQDKALIHPDFGILAARICISNLHKSTEKNFSGMVNYVQNKTGRFSQSQVDFVNKYANDIDNMIINQNDCLYSYIGLKVLEKSYLIKVDDVIVERPQYMLMRHAVCLYWPEGVENPSPEYEAKCLRDIKNCYKTASRQLYTPATPSLFNSMYVKQNLISCFLLGTADSTRGIMKMISDSAEISANSGGIGFETHSIRAHDSYIRGTGGKSSGLPMQLRIQNENMNNWNQGGKRNGSAANYIGPEHADCPDILQLKLHSTPDNKAARDLFYAQWIPDRFVRAVVNKEKWHLFSPSEAPGLADVYDVNYDKLYTEYVEKKLYRKELPALDIYNLIMDSQADNGTPYICFKDHANRKTNQKNIGVIKCSNLCAEIMEVCTPDEYACCTLSSINIKKFLIDPYNVDPDQPDKNYDYQWLHEIAKQVTRNLNKAVDRNVYPVPEAKKSNTRHRPLGVGIQGLADLFCMMRIPFESSAARQINSKIMETIYHGCLEASNELAIEESPYETFFGSPFSEGKFQFDLWEEFPAELNPKINLSGMWDWNALKQKVMAHGTRNSLLTSLMPTASTATILDNSESFEPYTSNIFTRNLLSGKVTVINPHLIRHLIDLDLWSPSMKQKIIDNNGSVQGISEIPKNVQEIYKTVFEISQKVLMEMSADRGIFVDQSQSLNIFLRNATPDALFSVFYYGWRLGLKTGSYYIRTEAAVDANKTGLGAYVNAPNSEALVCKPGCDSCSS